MIATAMMFTAALTANASEVSPVSTEKPVSVGLVHGALVDGSGWQAIYDTATRDSGTVVRDEAGDARGRVVKTCEQRECA